MGKEDSTGKGPRTYKIPPGDHRDRLVCPECDYIVYENPKVVVGSVVHHEGKVLLCQRSIEPRRGYWTIPAGFLEMGESAQEGALREAKEEACAELKIHHLTGIYSLRRIGQVQLMYHATLEKDGFAVGEESLDVKLFNWEDIPWNELAFQTVHWVLRHEEKRKDSKERLIDERAG